jgi:hypothetical protein
MMFDGDCRTCEILVEIIDIHESPYWTDEQKLNLIKIAIEKTYKEQSNDNAK